MRSSIIALAAASLVATPAFAEDSEASRDPIIVTGQRHNASIEQAPSTHVAVTQEEIARKVNAVSVEDMIKYLPSLVIRKRHIGDNFAPIATRTSGLGASARSLIYADGALLSALIANNNGNGSPRWSLVTPEEIERIDILYGPFSAAYSGNSIGTVVNITTRLPEKLEARATALVNVQQYSLYGTNRTLPTRQFSGSIGDRFGPLSLFGSVTRTIANSQPVSFISIGGTADPAGTTGGYADVSRIGAPIRILGAGGLEHHVQDTWKLKAALDLGAGVSLRYVLGLWTDDTRGTVDTYLRSATGAPSFATANIGTTAGFNSAVYRRDARHLSHAVSLQGDSPRLDWQVIGTSYDYARDRQSNPSTATSGATVNRLPVAFAGGPGTIQRQDGTGWLTLDAKAALHLGPDDAHILSIGGHADRNTLRAATYLASNWLDDATEGALSTTSRGRTRTLALWAQDVIGLAPQLSLTLGARHEWWRAWGGFNQVASGASVIQPERRFSGISPKASLEWRPASQWSARLSLGQAWRLPTVGELYQATSVGVLLTNPNPNLRPERARSAELAIDHHDDRGSVRLSLFNEIIDDALISQTGIVGGTGISATFVQNVDRTRARGVELAIDRRDIVPHFDLQGSVTYADAVTSRNSVFPAAEGKLLPSVPHWKATAVVTWRPSKEFSLTTAARYASRNYATLDNSDSVGNTYQGFYKYFVVDARAQFRVTDQFNFALGVDNLGNRKYFLFHPFPQRSFTAEVNWKL
ncbi:TonB-dependent receptor [Sphingobium sp. AN558]|uniref:TonB-dependent receptor n=1 Tax=Sphingobium sp. AN558 TaxID=3133442 RepID=UPI0030BB875A